MRYPKMMLEMVESRGEARLAVIPALRCPAVPRAAPCSSTARSTLREIRGLIADPVRDVNNGK